MLQKGLLTYYVAVTIVIAKILKMNKFAKINGAQII